MNCIGNPEVLYSGRGYSNRSFITLQGCTSSHTLSPLTAMYTSCISATFKRNPGKGIGHDLTNHTSPKSRFIAYSGSIGRESGRRFHYGPERCVQGSRVTKQATRYTGPRAYRITAHPSGQRCARPPAYYKHQKLLATPGQRTGVVNKSRESIKDPNVW